MSAAELKILQYLNEARASELALARVLESQIAMTPQGSYRDALDTHHHETHAHANRVGKRIEELGESATLLTSVVGLAETVVGQLLAIGKTPIDMLRGTGGEEKVLKNAKDTCATEALEIATYTAIERLADALGDKETAKLAASIRADEERMLARVLREIPKLTEAVVSSDVYGQGSYDVATTGAGQAVRKVGARAKTAARKTESQAKTTARKTESQAKTTARKTGSEAKTTVRKARSTTARNARKVPGVANAEGAVRGVIASESDLPIARYDSLTVGEIIDRLKDLSQIELTTVDVYERRHEGRSTLLSRIETLRAEEPWKGYDQLTVRDIAAVISERDEKTIKAIQTYERAHKARAGVLEATEQQLVNA